MRRVLASLVAIAAVVIGKRADAAPNVAIEIQAPAAETANGCPDRGDFFAELQKRVPGATLTDPSAAAHAARLRITAGPSGFEGTLELASQGAEPTSRTVQGPSCAEVGEALALVLALAVEQREVEVREKARSEPPREPIIGEAPVGPPKWSVGAVLQGTARAGVGRDIAPGASGAVELRQSGSGIGFRPSIRVGVAGSVADWQLASRLGPANATMYALIVNLDGCALRASTRTEWLAIDLCARFEAGFVEGHVKPVSRGGSNAPWMLVAAVLRTRVVLIGPVFGEVEGSLGAPLARNRWRLGDDRDSVPVYEQPSVAPGAALGLGVTFP